MSATQTQVSVPEDQQRLVTLRPSGKDGEAASVIAALENDMVVLVREVDERTADRLVLHTAQGFGLEHQLRLQAALASSLGHRRLVSESYMTVNKRRDFQVVTPHSEGSSFIGLQLASFYAYENTTDGGETILFNVNQDSGAWPHLREVCVRGQLRDDRVLTRREIAEIRITHRLNIPADLLVPEDWVLKEHSSASPFLRIFDVLARPRRTYSRILRADVHAYWDSIGASDRDSFREFCSLLSQCELLREPPTGGSLDELDSQSRRRVWNSGTKYAALFKAKVTHKMIQGDLVLMNNLTWSHSVANWSPQSGTRNVVAAFA